MKNNYRLLLIFGLVLLLIYSAYKYGDHLNKRETSRAIIQEYLQNQQEYTHLLRQILNLKTFKENSGTYSTEFVIKLKQVSEQMYYSEKLHLASGKIPGEYRILNQDGMLLIDSIWRDVTEHHLSDTEVRIKLQNFTIKLEFINNEINRKNLENKNMDTMIKGLLEVIKLADGH
ncbi:hypothetical protein SD71_14985 [Cohnella kolymensis]|uniref:Uncharacterized protein n=2 Tax=Cohnella kolymensis TaxID=1590652 RepID=A0ABR5A371_9BACL|nr:hypothetical protein SD71_14985 [Cohnella kolymensis]